MTDRVEEIRASLANIPPEDLDSSDDAIAWLLAEVERLTRERDGHEANAEKLAEDVCRLLEKNRAAEADLSAARGEIADISRAIGTVEYMDPPDGGSVTLAEQVARMRERVTALLSSSRAPEPQPVRETLTGEYRIRAVGDTMVCEKRERRAAAPLPVTPPITEEDVRRAEAHATAYYPPRSFAWRNCMAEQLNKAAAASGVPPTPVPSEGEARE